MFWKVHDTYVSNKNGLSLAQVVRLSILGCQILWTCRNISYDWMEEIKFLFNFNIRN